MENDEEQPRLTVREFLSFRKSLYKQSSRFCARQSEEVTAIFQLDHITDPSCRVTEERLVENELDRLEEHEIKVERTVTAATASHVDPGAGDTGGLGSQQRLVTIPRQRWSSILLMAVLMSLFVLIPMSTYELVLGQIYQGSLSRTLPMRHPRLSGVGIIAFLFILLSVPEALHNLGSGLIYMKFCFQTPLAWSLSDADYRSCGDIKDPNECRADFRCTMFDSICVANPYKYAEHHFNQTILSHTYTRWPPDEVTDWPKVWSFNWHMAAAACVSFAILWTMAELGGKRVIEFLAIGGVGLDIFVLAMLLPFAINLTGAATGLRKAFLSHSQLLALVTPRDYFTVLSVMLSGAPLLCNINSYIGMGFRIDHPRSRFMPILAYTLVLVQSFFMALVESSLTGSMDPLYRQKLKSVLIRQTGKDFLGLDTQFLPTAMLLQSELAPSTARNWGTIITPVMLANLYGATEWSLLFFVAAVLRRGVRCVLLIRALRAWVQDARHVQDKHIIEQKGMEGVQPRSKTRCFIESFLTCFLAIGLTSLLLFRYGSADGQLLSARLTAAISEAALPLALTLLAFTDFWLLSPNGFAYDSAAATLVVVLAFMMFLLATICTALSGPRALDQMFLNWVALAVVAIACVAPSTILILHYGRQFREWWPFTQAIACNGRSEELRKKTNIIMGVWPPWSRLRRVTFSFALKCLIPFLALGVYIVPLAQTEKRAALESWAWNPSTLIYMTAPAGPPFELPLSIIYFFNSTVIVGTAFLVGCCCPSAIRWMWPYRIAWWTMRDLARKKDPGAKHVLRRKSISIWEELFASTSALWKESFRVRPARRF